MRLFLSPLPHCLESSKHFFDSRTGASNNHSGDPPPRLSPLFPAPVLQPVHFGSSRAAQAHLARARTCPLTPRGPLLCCLLSIIALQSCFLNRESPNTRGTAGNARGARSSEESRRRRRRLRLRRLGLGPEMQRAPKARVQARQRLRSERLLGVDGSADTLGRISLAGWQASWSRHWGRREGWRRQLRLWPWLLSVGPCGCGMQEPQRGDKCFLLP